ncbi:MAG: TIGR03960 family B12-binding radical SAM protein [Desulfobacteraceae bacterium]|nr:MAG: TIGR03960 family B12-binding radical SAM protein [Desulfobacteraceae bacterium]
MSWKEKRKTKYFSDCETGAVRKQWKGHVRVALVYPNVYALGMSNLGFQTVYKLLNGLESVLCERAFLPENDTSPLQTIESSRQLADFDIIAFSVSFENDFVNILSILERAGLPPKAIDRGIPHPLVMAGGVACFINPEPVSEFIDCFFIGEAEGVIERFFSLYEPGTLKKDLLLKIARNLPGIYVPAFYETSYNKDGTLASFSPIVPNMPEKIQRVYVKDISALQTCSSIISRDTAFDRTFLIEVSRGCPHGCRFCSAGYIYRPPRFSTVFCLEKCIDKGTAVTDKLGFVGAAVSDLPGIVELCGIAQEKEAKISFSSLRADALSVELVSALKKSGVKTATIAPDGGSQRIRKVINKGITEEQILAAAEKIIEGGIPNIKLYFMTGLPTETIDDVEEIVILCRKIKKSFLSASRTKKRIGQITVSINPFVPKPFTPFQWFPMEGLTSLKEKMAHIKEGLRKEANIRTDFEPPRRSYVQALISRGDRRISGILSRANANKGNWAKTLKASTLDPAFYVYREKLFDELLPWDFIDHGINKSFLIKEYKKALLLKESLPCPTNSCNKCGVCGEIVDNVSSLQQKHI